MKPQKTRRFRRATCWRHFRKPHKNVLRAIDNVLKTCAEGSDHRLNFEPMIYLDDAGKGARREQRMYRMDRRSFSVLVMRFTGPQALSWQLDFYDAFDAMERQLVAQRDREANALYALRPRWKAIAEHPEYRRQQLIGLTGHRSPASITACRRRMREVGLF